MPDFSGFGGGGTLAEMAGGLKDLLSSSSDYYRDQTPETRLPTHIIEFVGVTKKCSSLKGFEDTLVVQDYSFALTRPVHADSTGELRASGSLGGSHVQAVVIDSGQYPILLSKMNQGSIIDTIKIIQVTVVNEQEEKGVIEVGVDEFCGCFLTSMMQKAGDKMLLTFRYGQYLPTRKILDSDGKVAGNVAGSLDLGTGEVGKVKQGK